MFLDLIEYRGNTKIPRLGMWLSGRVLTHLARTWVWLPFLPPHENINPTTLMTILFTTEISLKGQMAPWVEALRRGLGEVHDT